MRDLLASIARPPVIAGDLKRAGVQREQGFSVNTVETNGLHGLRLTAETEMGLRNGLLTLSDRLYRNSTGDMVVDSIDGEHVPFFQARCIKTDTMHPHVPTPERSVERVRLLESDHRRGRP